MATTDASNGIGYSAEESVDSDAPATPYLYMPSDLTDYLCDLRHRIPRCASQQGTSVNAQLVMK